MTEEGLEMVDYLKNIYQYILWEARLRASHRAADVLPIWEDVFPGDYRPRRAVETAFAYLHGEADIHSPEYFDACEAVRDALKIEKETHDTYKLRRVKAAKAAAIAAELVASPDFLPFEAETYASEAEELWKEANASSE